MHSYLCDQVAAFFFQGAHLFVWFSSHPLSVVSLLMSSRPLWLPHFRDEDELEPVASQAEARAEAVERLTLLFVVLAACIVVLAWHTWRQDFVARTRAFGPLFRERLPQRPLVTARKQDKILQRLEQRAQALDVKLRRFASRPLAHAAWPARPPGTWYAPHVFFDSSPAGTLPRR